MCNVKKPHCFQKKTPIVLAFYRYMIYFKTKYQSTLVKVTFNQIAGKFWMILAQIIQMYSTKYILYFVVGIHIYLLLLTYVWTFNRSAFAYGLFVEDIPVLLLAFYMEIRPPKTPPEEKSSFFATSTAKLHQFYNLEMVE